MKLEFLRDGALDCPLICLYAFTKREVSILKEMFVALSDGSRQEVALHAETGVSPIHGCQLYLGLGAQDLGILESDELKFTFVLTKSGWADVALLVDPFCDQDGSSGRYQWLNEDGPISLLLSDSTNGLW